MNVIYLRHDFPRYSAPHQYLNSVTFANKQMCGNMMFIFSKEQPHNPMCYQPLPQPRKEKAYKYIISKINAYVIYDNFVRLWKCARKQNWETKMFTFFMCLI